MSDFYQEFCGDLLQQWQYDMSPFGQLPELPFDNFQLPQEPEPDQEPNQISEPEQPTDAQISEPKDSFVLQSIQVEEKELPIFNTELFLEHAPTLVYSENVIDLSKKKTYTKKTYTKRPYDRTIVKRGTTYAKPGLCKRCKLYQDHCCMKVCHDCHALVGCSECGTTTTGKWRRAVSLGKGRSTLITPDVPLLCSSCYAKQRRVREKQ